MIQSYFEETTKQEIDINLSVGSAVFPSLLTSYAAGKASKGQSGVIVLFNEWFIAKNSPPGVCAS